MFYLMHNKERLSEKNKARLKKYFSSIDILKTKVKLEEKEYEAIVDTKSFMHLTNFDCFNCLTNCCVQFPYGFNKKARKVIKENLKEYDNLTKAVSILKFEGMIESEILDSIENDDILIPEEYKDKSFDRCTCSCVYEDRHLCALHKMCLDLKMSMEEILDTKPIWCSLYPLEIVLEEESGRLYIFVPTEKNSYLSLNDSDFPCMNIEKSRSPYFRRENPIGFKESEYKPFIDSYYNILKYLLGERFIKDLSEKLELDIDSNKKIQYEKEIK